MKENSISSPSGKNYDLSKSFIQILKNINAIMIFKIYSKFCRWEQKLPWFEHCRHSLWIDLAVCILPNGSDDGKFGNLYWIDHRRNPLISKRIALSPSYTWMNYIQNTHIYKIKIAILYRKISLKCLVFLISDIQIYIDKLHIWNSKIN